MENPISDLATSQTHFYQKHTRLEMKSKGKGGKKTRVSAEQQHCAEICSGTVCSLRSAVSKLAHSMFDEVPGHSLVMTRVLWGLIFIYQTIRYMDDTKIQMFYAPAEEGGPDFQFRYWLFSEEDLWPPRISTVKFWMLLKLNLLLGFMMTIGCLYHVTTAIFFVSSLFIYLQEASLYLNHMYLALFLQFIFIFLPMNRMYSIDCKLGLVKRSNTVPRWSVLIIRIIISNVYVWAGIAKMNKDWLFRALPLRFWLPRRVGTHPNIPFFDTIMGSTKAAYFMCWTGCIYDTFLPALLYAGGKWRWMGFALSIVFHISNKLMFNIGIFPIFCIALSFLYFDFDWPLGFARFLLLRVLKFKINRNRFQVKIRHRTRDGILSIKEKLSLAFILMVSAQQILFPARHFILKGDVAWSERGHMYSWRMKLRDKAGFVKCAFRIDIPDQPGIYHWEELPSQRHLNFYQMKTFAGRPELVHQYAHWLGRMYKKIGEDGEVEEDSPVLTPAVHCFAISSVNCRDPQFLINPLFNLAEIPPWSNDDFIIEKLSDAVSRDHPLLPPPLDKYDHKKECVSPKLFASYKGLRFDEVWRTFIEAAEAGLVTKPPNMPTMSHKGSFALQHEHDMPHAEPDGEPTDLTIETVVLEDERFNGTSANGNETKSNEDEDSASQTGEAPDSCLLG